MFPMNLIIECYRVNSFELMLIRDEIIEHRLRTDEFRLPEDWQKKNEVYVKVLDFG